MVKLPLGACRGWAARRWIWRCCHAEHEPTSDDGFRALIGSAHPITLQWPGSCRHSFDIGCDDPFRASGGARQGEQPLPVVGHGHQAPLAADSVEAAEQELAEPQYRFDDAEHRLGGLLA